MPEDRLSLIARLQALIHDCLAAEIGVTRPVLLDFPDHPNVGDSAIWLGEMAYLRDRHGLAPAYVCTRKDYAHDMVARLPADAPILIHGGGNFGDVWPAHQQFREQIFERWRGRRIVQLPQSIHFADPARAEATARIIERHGNMLLLVRDEESRAFAERHFPCEVRLCPDMAFCIGPMRSAAPAVLPVLALLRTDIEAAISPEAAERLGVPVEDWITDDPRALRNARRIGKLRGMLRFDPRMMRALSLDSAARSRVRRGVVQVSRARALVTDRLHVHILSLLLNMPHAVLDNSYGKISRYMDAFTGTTDLGYRASSLADGVAWAKSVALERSK